MAVVRLRVLDGAPMERAARLLRTGDARAAHARGPTAVPIHPGARRVRHWRGAHTADVLLLPCGGGRLP